MDFTYKLLKWYQVNKRDLPWRNVSDPYLIWISEVILQQTRVNQGLPYYLRFVEKFQTVSDLAQVSEDEVLKIWQGLGYYSRARNMHATAKQVCDELDGIFPSSYQKLLSLKGIGPYTAAAIASICNNEPVPAIDGNAYRVLSRYFGIDTPINASKARAEFTLLASRLLPHGQSGTFNQALMEFGALCCVPSSPNCAACVFSESCLAYRSALVDQLPVKTKLKERKPRFFVYLHIECNNKVLLTRRAGKDIWHGLYEFPLIEIDASLNCEAIPELLSKHIKELSQAIIKNVTQPINHTLTHQQLQAVFVHIQLQKKDEFIGDAEWFDQSVLFDFPVHNLMRRYINDHI